MLTFDYIDEKVVVVPSTKWTELPDRERKFLSKCYWIGLLGSEIVNDKLYIVRISYGQLKALKEELASSYYSEVVEFTDAFIEYAIERKKEYDEAKVREEEKRAHEQHIVELRKTVERAYTVRREGCGWCKEKEYDFRTRTHRCKFTGKTCKYRPEDLEWEVEVQRDVKMMGAFQAQLIGRDEYFAPPYPMAGCKVIYEGQKALEELSKLEGIGNVS